MLHPVGGDPVWVLRRSSASENYSPWAIGTVGVFSRFSRTLTCDRQTHNDGLYRTSMALHSKKTQNLLSQAEKLLHYIISHCYHFTTDVHNQKTGSLRMKHNQTVPQKNDTDVAYYNFDMDKPILIIFDR